MKRLWKSFAALAMLTGLLGGCAVYQPAPVYSQAPAYSTYSAPAPVYAAPAPVYVQPAPVYVGPPVTFGFNFGYWSGRGWRHR